MSSHAALHRQQSLVKALEEIVKEFGAYMDIRFIAQVDKPKETLLNVVLIYTHEGNDVPIVIESPTLHLRCNWLGHCDMDPHDVQDWQPLNKGNIFAWWWYRMVEVALDTGKEERAKKILQRLGLR